jgi:hypothetical protein
VFFSFQFIYALFSDAGSGLDCSVFFLMVGLLVDWKYVKGNVPWLIWGEGGGGRS